MHAVRGHQPARSRELAVGILERGDDVMSQLLDVQLDGDKLTDFELNAFFMFLAAAGNEMTRNDATRGLLGFLESPDQWEKLVEDPEDLVPSATEEILRWASPVMQLRRNVTADTELRAQTMKAGDKVSIWYISANRDEEVFEDPFRFDIDSNPTSTSPLWPVVHTSASARAWHAWSCACCSTSWHGGSDS
jgi:cytochrome P450